MNRHGERYIDVQQFVSHAWSLRILGLSPRELEFYERHCLLLPMARTRMPTAYAIKRKTHGLADAAVRGPAPSPPKDWDRLQRGHTDGLHAFDAQRGRNPFLEIPDCSTFEEWGSDRVPAVMPDGRTVLTPTVERHYAPWQVHVVALLRQQKHHYVHSQFLQYLDPSHQLWKRYRLPEDTEELRSLNGMAAGFDAVELFLFADEAAHYEAFDGVSVGERLPAPRRERLGVVLGQRARRSLDMSGMDEPKFFEFLGKLAELIHDYRSDERIALSEDAQEYLRDAERLAGHAFGYDWEDFFAAAEEHGGLSLATRLRHLDPVESAARDAREVLRAVLNEGLAATIASDCGDPGDVAEDIVEFCKEHDLLEVLMSLQSYSFTITDQHHDRVPGLLNRRLRPLALAVEQLARVLVEESSHLRPSEGSRMPRSLREFIRLLGQGCSWIAEFKRLESSDQNDDRPGDLERRALDMSRAALSTEKDRDGRIASTLGAAVATRNLVSHRPRFLPSHIVEPLSGACADALVLVWTLARSKEWV